MKKLVLLRDGESEWNKLNLYTGWVDVDLSEKGCKDAKQAGQTLMKEGYDSMFVIHQILKEQYTR